MNQASILTLQKNAKGYTDFEEIPKGIYVDTSAWICAYGSQNQIGVLGNGSAKRGKEIAEFMKDCIASEVTLYHSELVLKEAVHTNRRAHLNYFVESGQVSIPHNMEVNSKKTNEIISLQYPEKLQEINKSQNGLLSFIRDNSILLPYESDEESFDDFMKVTDLTKGLMDTQDITHVLTARSYDINSFLTADGDFLYLDNDNIFVPQNEKYGKAKIGRANVLLPFKNNEY